MSQDCWCGYDPPAFYVCEVRRARKSHTCDECGGAIVAAESYEHVRAKWDYVDTIRTCERCVDIRTWTTNNVPCLCWAHHNLINDCREAVVEAHYRAPEETRGLRFRLERMIVRRDRLNRARRKA
jgi:hypothetical protein